MDARERHAISQIDFYARACFVDLAQRSTLSVNVQVREVFTQAATSASSVWRFPCSLTQAVIGVAPLDPVIRICLRDRVIGVGRFLTTLRAFATEFAVEAVATICAGNTPQRVTRRFARVVPLVVLAMTGILNGDRPGILFGVVHAEQPAGSRSSLRKSSLAIFLSEATYLI